VRPGETGALSCFQAKRGPVGFGAALSGKVSLHRLARRFSQSYKDPPPFPLLPPSFTSLPHCRLSPPFFLRRSAPPPPGLGRLLPIPVPCSCMRYFVLASCRNSVPTPLTLVLSRPTHFSLRREPAIRPCPLIRRLIPPCPRYSSAPTATVRF